MFAKAPTEVTAVLPYRKDIDGLRFFAIVPVVLYHAIGEYIPSGFVGVDIFFAISGFLIGGIIYRESSSGSFSFLNFYARRARRILPALLAVIIITSVVGFLLLSTEEMMLLAGSGQWTVLGISNVFFFKHIDYFSPDASINPLLMTWSLGIEEQFYILFPVLLLALRPLRPRHHLLGLLAFVALSLVVSIYCAAVYPLSGFYLLPARAWEMGAGAALAIVHARTSRERRWGTASDSLALAGLAMIIASWWLFSERTPFPGYAALLPIGGTLLLLHTADSRINAGFLSGRLFTGIGLVSYSWYLWHWPLMAYVRASAQGTPKAVAMLLVAFVSLVFALASYRFVEQPFRHGKLPAKGTLVRYGATVALVLVALQWIKHEDAYATMRLSQQALEVERVQAESFNIANCMAGFGETELPAGDECNPSGATVALFGDSHAMHLRIGLREHVESQGLKLLQITKASCPPLLGFSHRDKLSPYNLAECARFQARAVDRIKRDPAIRTVVMAAYLGRPGGQSEFAIDGDRYLPVPAEIAFSRGTRAMAMSFQRAGKHVVVVLDVPKYDQNIYKRVLSRSIPLRHALGQWTSREVQPHSDLAATATMRATLARAVGDIPGVTVIDLAEQFCSPRCHYSAHGVSLYVDAQHLSSAGSRAIRWTGLPIND